MGNAIIDIKGINKPKILHALLNHAKFSYSWAGDMKKDYSLQEAKELLSHNDTRYFSYVKGKKLDINLNGNKLYTHAYNTHNGKNSCYDAIKHLLTKKN